MEKPKLRIISGIPARIIIEAGDSRREREMLPGRQEGDGWEYVETLDASIRNASADLIKQIEEFLSIGQGETFDDAWQKEARGKTKEGEGG